MRAAADPEFRRKASRGVLTNIRGARDYEERRLQWAMKNNVTLAEFYDRTLYAVANREAQNRTNRMNELKASGDGRCANKAACTTDEARKIANDEISQRVRQAVWQATTEHEVGHTLGLRHNFQGSFDAINYFDKYWELRRPTLLMVQNGEVKIPRTPGDMKTAADGTLLQLAGTAVVIAGVVVLSRK